MEEPRRHSPTNDEIRARTRQREDVDTPELGEGCFITVCVMSAASRLALEIAIEADKDQLRSTLLLAHAAIDPETGRRRFTDDDVAWLSHEAEWTWVARCVAAAARLNGMQAGAVETEAKN